MHFHGFLISTLKGDALLFSVNRRSLLPLHLPLPPCWSLINWKFYALHCGPTVLLAAWWSRRKLPPERETERDPHLTVTTTWAATATVTVTGMRAACVALHRIKANGTANYDLRNVLCIFNEEKNEDSMKNRQREDLKKDRERKEGEIERRQELAIRKYDEKKEI